MPSRTLHLLAATLAGTLAASCTPGAPKDLAADSGGDSGGGDSGADSGGGDSGGGDSGAATVPTERPANPTCLAPDRPASGGDVALPRVYSSLTFTHPVAVAQPPDDATRLYVLEQGGQVRWFPVTDDAVRSTTVALDLSARLSTESINEDGLLGFAFHPDFATNGELYVNYTAGSSSAGTLHTVVARYTSADGGDSFDPGSGEILIEVDQPYTNHNGGHLAFGPDGFLYIGLGDGGSGGDPQGNGQDTDALLGKMLRIDVDHVDGGRPYAIPADNPFADGGGAPEIFAWGLRNPWRYSFDRATGDLWVGDVGQDSYEEIDVVRLGGNYGWNAMEGFHCYRGRDCDPGLYQLPVVEIDHDHGDSILGGVVYRGAAIPALVGSYVFADTYRGTFWRVGYDEVTGDASAEVLVQVDGLAPASMGEDADGEVYVVDWSGGGLYRFEEGEAAPPDTFPQLLSQTGCVDGGDPTQPAEGLLPYGVNVPLWSDGAEKRRWMALPDGETVHVEADGTFTFPVGSVLMKEFRLGGERVETRLLVRHEDGAWAGYSYAWREDGTDAELLPAGETRTYGDQAWTFPSRAQCLRCHTEAGGRVLGARVPQLNGDYTYPGGGTANQLDVLDAIGWFDASPGDAAALPAWPGAGTSGDAAAEARAYLAVNCAVCHAPDGTGGGPMDFRYDTALAETHACDEAPVNGDLGVEDARILAPGDPGRSLVSVRMHALDASRMPPIGTSLVDPAGTALVDGWIAGLTGCE